MTEYSYAHITPTLHGAALIVSIREAMLRDAPTCYALRDEIVAAIDLAEAENLVLDLKAVEFIGSIGFLAFLGARRRLTSGRIILCNMSENIHELFRVCALISADASKPGPFEVAESVETALVRL